MIFCTFTPELNSDFWVLLTAAVLPKQLIFSACHFRQYFGMKRVIPSVFHKSNRMAASGRLDAILKVWRQTKSIEKYRILVICPLIGNIQINKPIIRSNVFRLLLNCAVKTQAPRPECIWLHLFVCIPNTSRLSGSLEALPHISTWGGGCYLYPHTYLLFL